MLTSTFVFLSFFCFVLSMFSNPIVHLTRKQISGLEDNERNKNVREVCDVFYK